MVITPSPPPSPQGEGLPSRVYTYRAGTGLRLGRAIGQGRLSAYAYGLAWPVMLALPWPVIVIVSLSDMSGVGEDRC